MGQLDSDNQDPHADFYNQFEKVETPTTPQAETAQPDGFQLYPSKPYDPNLSAKQYAEGVAWNYPPSFVRNVISTGKALFPTNWDETVSQLGSLARGEYVKAFGEPSYEKPAHPTAWQKMYAPTPESISADVATATEFNKNFPPITKPKSDPAWSEFYKRLYEDPAGVTSVLAPELELSSLPFKGISKVTKGYTGPLKPLRDVYSGIGTGLGAAATLADPTATVLKGISLGKDLGSAALKGTVAAGTGVDPYAFEKANEAGALDPKAPVGNAGLTGQDMKDTFQNYANGKGNNEELANRVKSQIDSIYQDEIKNWSKDKSSLAGGKVPLNGIIDAINQQIDKIPKSDRIKPGPGSKYNPLYEAFSELDQMRTDLRKRQTLPPGSYDNSVLGMDQYKQGLWDKINRYGDSYAAGALTPVHTELLHVLSGVDPEYGALMSRYQSLQNEIKNMRSTVGSKAAANSSVAKMMKTIKTANGRSVIDTLNERDPSIGYALAGTMLHDALPATAGARGVEAMGTLTSAGAALLAGQPWLAAAIPVQAALQSPKLMGQTAYGAGAASRTLPGKVAGAAYKYIPPVVSTTARAVSPFEENLEQAYSRMYSGYEQPRAEGGRSAHASGGRTGMSAKDKAANLIAMVDRVRKEESKGTEPLLNLDDTTVAKALAMANKTI